MLLDSSSSGGCRSSVISAGLRLNWVVQGKRRLGTEMKSATYVRFDDEQPIYGEGRNNQHTVNENINNLMIHPPCEHRDWHHNGLSFSTSSFKIFSGDLNGVVDIEKGVEIMNVERGQCSHNKARKSIET